MEIKSEFLTYYICLTNFKSSCMWESPRAFPADITSIYPVLLQGTCANLKNLATYKLQTFGLFDTKLNSVKLFMRF